MKKNTLTWIDIAFAIGTTLFVIIGTWCALNPDVQMGILLVLMFGGMYMCASENFDRHLNRVLDKICKED